MAATKTQRRELAHRESAGIAVSLFWSPDGKTITVEVVDLRTDEYFALDVAPELALDAFHHPFAYLAELEGRETDETEEWNELLAA
jgi:hypothetical protein